MGRGLGGALMHVKTGTQPHWHVICLFGAGGIMRSVILYILGVPVTIIVLIALFTHHF